MSSLLSDAEKTELNAVYKNLADTFARPLVAYHEAEKVVLISDPNFNRLRKFNQSSTKVENIKIERTIQARVYYAPKQENPVQSFGGQGPQNKLRVSDGMVRIKIHIDDYDFMAKAKKVELDGNLYDIDTVERPHGLFGVEYYTYWLQRSQ